MNENNTAIKDARSLGLPKMLLLGLQHMFAMFGATILVPILVNTYFEGQGLFIQVTLMCAGLGTLFFHLYRSFTGAVRDRQRIDKLADCVDRAGNYHRF